MTLMPLSWKMVSVNRVGGFKSKSKIECLDGYNKYILLDVMV